MLERVVRELSPLPSANPDAVARIVAMATAPGAAPLPIAGRVERSDAARARRFSLAAAGSLAAAAAILGFVLRGFMPSSGTPASTVARVASSPAPGQVVASEGVSRLAARGSEAEAARSVQFVLHSPGARRVSLVGDFNGWDVGRSPMRDVTASGVWTVTVPVKPGRHVYAFLVDDTTWTLDPRAARTTDPDFGVSGSVMIVGVP